MNPKTRIIFIMAFILFIPLVCARTPMQNRPWDIIHSIRVSDGLPGTISCNITVFDPNNVKLVQFQPMTYNSNSYTANYTLPASNLSSYGEYCYDITCIQGTENKTESFCMTVTSTGRELSMPESILYIFILIILIGIFIFCVWGALNINTANMTDFDNKVIGVNYYKHIRWLMIVFAYISFTGTLYIAYNMSLAYIHQPAVTTLLFNIYRFVLVMAWPVSLLLVVLFCVKFIQDIKLDKQVQRGDAVFTDGY